MAEQKDMEMLADRLYRNFIRPQIKEEYINGNLADGVSPVGWYLATVTQALTSGKITVQRPFETTTVALTPVPSMRGATVGQQVIVLVFGGGANAANSVIFSDTSFSNL